MFQARPTAAPPGRLVRLGLVLGSATPDATLAQLARMGDRAGIGALWLVGDRPFDQLDVVAPVVERARLGVLVRPEPGSAEAMAVATAALNERLGGRLEVGLRLGRLGPIALEAYVEALRRLWPADPPPPAVSLETELGPSLAPAVHAADDALLVAASLEEVEALAEEALVVCAASGRDPATLGLAVTLPVSVGRTAAEAWARWESDEALAALGPPGEVAVFGTLEQCHQQVIRLAHAGVTDLRCVLPRAADVHDVIAQLTAMTIGTVAQLAPGAPRSPAPAPPAGWGGRPRFPSGS